jgi:hypothetical protein
MRKYTRVFLYVRGGDPRFVPLPPATRISDAKLEKLRLKHPGTTGRPPPGYKKGGLRTIAKKLGCSMRTVSRRLQAIAVREEGE